MIGARRQEQLRKKIGVKKKTMSGNKAGWFNKGEKKNRKGTEYFVWQPWLVWLTFVSEVTKSFKSCSNGKTNHRKAQHISPSVRVVTASHWRSDQNTRNWWTSSRSQTGRAALRRRQHSCHSDDHRDRLSLSCLRSTCLARFEAKDLLLHSPTVVNKA